MPSFPFILNPKFLRGPASVANISKELYEIIRTSSPSQIMGTGLSALPDGSNRRVPFIRFDSPQVLSYPSREKYRAVYSYSYPDIKSSQMSERKWVAFNQRGWKHPARSTGFEKLYPRFTLTSRGAGPKNPRKIKLTTEYRKNKNPEQNTPRRDSKVPGAYRKTLQIVNQTYGRYSEARDVIDAYTYSNGDVVSFANNLIMNQAVDYAFGMRARLLKEHLYEKDFYRLPVGIDFLFSPGY